MQAQYIKFKDNESEDEEDEGDNIAVVAPDVVPVPLPSPGDNCKHVDVRQLSSVDLDNHLTMLLQEKNCRYLGVAYKRRAFIYHYCCVDLPKISFSRNFFVATVCYRGR